LQQVTYNMTTDGTNTNQTPDNPTWFIDDGLPGTGPRPSWLNEKFKTVADLSKSYHELEKKVGTAPDDYDFSKTRYLDPEYGPLLDLKSVLKEKRVSQDVVDKFIETVDKYMDEFKTDPKEELAKLGDNAKERIEVLNNWAQANLSKEAAQALFTNLRNADAIKALEELRGKMMSGNTQIPNGSGNISNVATVEELKKELESNLQKYKTDEKYRKDWTGRMEVAAKNIPGYVDKVGV
jgi:hypothetical protein